MHRKQLPTQKTKQNKENNEDTADENGQFNRSSAHPTRESRWKINEGRRWRRHRRRRQSMARARRIRRRRRRRRRRRKRRRMEPWEERHLVRPRHHQLEDCEGSEFAQPVFCCKFSERQWDRGQCRPPGWAWIENLEASRLRLLC